MAVKTKPALKATLNLNITTPLNKQNTALRVKEIIQDIIDSMALVGAGGSQTLEQTLALGNATGANDISITTARKIIFNNSTFTASIIESTLTGNINLTLPNATGTLALVSQIPSITNLWTYNGNTVTSLKTLGTLDNFDLPFITNGVERARILASNGYFGVGLNNPTATIHAQGADILSTSYALKVQNSAASPMLFVQNNGNVGIGTATPSASLHITGSASTSATYTAKFQNSSTGSILAMLDDRTVGINNVLSASNAELYVGDGARTRSGIIVTTNTAGSYTGEKYAMEVGGGTWGMGFDAGKNAFTFTGSGGTTSYFFGGASHTSTTPKFHYDGQQTMFAVNVGWGLANAVGHFKRSIAGIDSDKLLLAETSGGTDQFVVYNNGLISMGGLQTGNAGLASGDLYVDTAANVLANGDMVVARKV